MSHTVSFDGEKESINLHTKEGAYQHLGWFLRKHAAPSPVFSSLGKLFPGHTEKAANDLWDTVTGLLTQEQIDKIQHFHKDDLDQLGVI